MGTTPLDLIPNEYKRKSKRIRALVALSKVLSANIILREATNIVLNPLSAIVEKRTPLDHGQGLMVVCRKAGGLTEPRVAILILNWNGLEDTTECLQSLQKVSYSNYEVVVVDNGSEGDEAAVLREKFGGSIHLLENDKNEGFAEGNNIGMRYALERLDPQ